MMRYFHKFKKSDPVQKPRFAYSVMTDIQYNGRHLELASLFDTDDDPITERKKAMRVYSETRRIIEFLVHHSFFKEDDDIEFCIEVFSRITNDTIQLLGAGADLDLENLALEYETLNNYGYISVMEPTMVVLDGLGKEVTILQTDLIY